MESGTSLPELIAMSYTPSELYGMAMPSACGMAALGEREI